MSCEEEDTCNHMSYEEEDTCNTCNTYKQAIGQALHVEHRILKSLSFEWLHIVDILVG
jgi:hypothetical protein